MKDTDKFFVPVKTQDEKLASIDSSIESCIEILRQEIRKRQKIRLDREDEEGTNSMMNALTELRAQFLAIKPE